MDIAITEKASQLSRYGFWRFYVMDVIYKYLDCGDLLFGFARVKESVFCASNNYSSYQKDTPCIGREGCWVMGMLRNGMQSDIVLEKLKNAAECEFRRSRPPIPIDSGHPFRRKPATFSEPSSTVFLLTNF